MLRMAGTRPRSPAPAQALVEVVAFFFDLDEFALRMPDLPDGTPPGWDATGTVVTPAADGSGPPTGTRVVTFGWTAGSVESPRGRPCPAPIG